MVSRSRLAREGMIELLRVFSSIRVCSAHATLRQAMGELVTETPDVMVVDVSDGDHTAEIQSARTMGLEVPIVVYGVKREAESIVRYAKAGARGYLRSEARRAEWKAALHGAIEGGIADPRVAGILNDYVYSHAKTKTSDSPSSRDWSVRPAVDRSGKRAGLTPREKQVLSLIDDGLSTKAIAKTLDCSPSTVKAHVASILTKYKVHRRAEAAALFRRSKEATGDDERQSA
jgi:DNA-binding NarL/FixJ family response regulator